ncbi:hypothetical protein D043_2202A, partial [Vibrio parahaemolyticus EKP-021]
MVSFFTAKSGTH